MDNVELRTANGGLEASGRARIIDPAEALNRNHGCRCAGQTTDTEESGDVYYSSCEEAKIKVMPDQEILSTGRVLDVTLTLRNVCPCRHISVGYLVTEVDENNNEHARGFKAFTVEPHYYASCRDMELESTRFILPDDARVDGCSGQCEGTRHFIVRAEAHYADTAVTTN